MRFHVGVSMNLKRIIKYLIPVAMVFFGTMFFNTQTVYASDMASPPSNCQTGSVSDMVCSAFEGYYTLSDSTNNQCNVFLGDITSLNLRTRQVEAAINYTASSISLTQTSSQYSGTTQSNLGARFYRGDFSYELYLSYKVSNLGESLSCKTAYIHSSCDAPAVTVYYCPTDSFASNISDCYQENIGGTRTGDTAYDSDITDQLGYRVATKENYKLKTNAEIHQVSGYNNNLNYDYIQITYNTLTAGTIATPNIGAFWEYYGLYFGDQQIDNDWNTKSSNYCSNTGGPNWSGGGNSVLEDTTQAIHDTLEDTTLPTFEDSYLNDTIFNSSSLSEILLFPIEMLTAILDNKDTCTPYSINLSSITRRWGGSDYVLTLPCIRQTVRNKIGSQWYDAMDYMIAGILLYYFASNLVLKVNDLLSGVDTMPFYYQSSSRGRTTTPAGYSLVNNATGEVRDG